MYGLLLDGIQKFLREKYGERYWLSIRRRANLQNHWFVTHEVYPDSVMLDLVEAAAIELGEDKDTVMMMFGEYFAENIGRYGYARLLRVLGRDLRDFLNGLDDLHEYLRFSYPKMRPPSFFCENETPNGMLLHYTTKRRGYLCYVIGQLKTVGKIYGKDLDINIEMEEVNGEETHVVLGLKFDNSEMLLQRQPSTVDNSFSISSDTFLSIFPFCIYFSNDLVITRVGDKLQEVLPNLPGTNLGEVFTLLKPHFGGLNWNVIKMHTNCMFEVVSVDSVNRVVQPDQDKDTSPPPHLRLKGQMLILSDAVSAFFLCSPAMGSPEDLYESGIFINDLSMHDSSRDFVLAGSQQNPELNLALSQEKIRSAQLEESIQRTDKLLFQMIPKPIADQLRNGETPLNTCKEFPIVSILFSDIVSFTPMCSRLRPMEVVCVLNAMYVAFDKLCEIHHVYKVETIGDAYMVISGAPIETPHHAEYITDFAFSILKATSRINDPSTNKSLRIRIGIHSGTVVAGVVGASILRYDVFGDTVNVAARMEATGEPMRIHVSDATAELLKGTDFVVMSRGQVEVKGKGLLSTYWVTEKKVVDSQEETMLMLNPFQRLRQSRSTSSPTTSRPSSPTHPAVTQPQSLLTPTKAVSQTAFPKPDEWPQADRRLSGEVRQRSGTMPTIEVPPGLCTPAIVSGTRHGSITTPANHVHLLPYRSKLYSPNESGASNGLHDNRPSRSNSIASEFDFMRTRRDSMACPLPTIAESSPSQLAVFAALADANARQARQLADWAAELARTAVRSRESSVDPDLEGTSVDPIPLPKETQVEESSQTSDPKTDCTIM